MRKPDFITFTGIDERTDFARVRGLSRRYPVEWGVLFSQRNQGKANRYPGLHVLPPLLAFSGIDARLRLSAHICGRYSNTIMESGSDLGETMMLYLSGRFHRTQINIADGETLVEDRNVRPSRAAKFARSISADRAIVQCRGRFPDNPEVDWLFDVSGGAGVMPSSWDAHAYASTAFCGYAGGIGPDNVLDVLERIALTHPEDKPYWIDMEGRIRTDDWLDLDKCEAVLRAVYGEGLA